MCFHFSCSSAVSIYRTSIICCSYMSHIYIYLYILYSSKYYKHLTHTIYMYIYIYIICGLYRYLPKQVGSKRRVQTISNDPVPSGLKIRLWWEAPVFDVSPLVLQFAQKQKKLFTLIIGFSFLAVFSLFLAKTSNNWWKVISGGG